MARVAYFYRHMTEFIRIEIELLRERHVVIVQECASRWPRPLALLNLIAGVDLATAWFASWHSFAPAVACRALGKPFVVTIGGYDTACLPDIGYGHQRGGFQRLVSLATMRLASRLIVISEATRREALALGLPSSRLTLGYLGLEARRYPGSDLPREEIAVTVGGVSRSNLTRKGLDAFVRAAALCPRVRFVVIGAWMDDGIERLRAIAAPNVHFTGVVSHEEKVAWLSRARVVVQASRHEAFGLALAEGMLCGAVPVATRAGALPEVTGDCGVLIESQDPTAVARGVRRALSLGAGAGARARASVLDRFGIERRRRMLEGVIAAELSLHSHAASAGPGERASGPSMLEPASVPVPLNERSVATGQEIP